MKFSMDSVLTECGRKHMDSERVDGGGGAGKSQVRWEWKEREVNCTHCYIPNRFTFT